MNVLALDKPLDFASLTCPACGIDTSHDMDANYMTAFLPGSGKWSLEIPTCAPCAVRIRQLAQVGAFKLEERESRGREPQGPSTLIDRSSVWDELGITRRA